MSIKVQLLKRFSWVIKVNINKQFTASVYIDLAQIRRPTRVAYVELLKVLTVVMTASNHQRTNDPSVTRSISHFLMRAHTNQLLQLMTVITTIQNFPVCLNGRGQLIRPKKMQRTCAHSLNKSNKTNRSSLY